jgi:protein-L-isoaspartate O-methyltransferase
MVIPIGEETEMQMFTQVDKDYKGEVKIENLSQCMYVPLTSQEHQCSRNVNTT